jgi:Flp pilus assembly protein TadG
MVTAELAVALPALVLVALFALSGVQVAMTQLRCRDAAGVAARLAARGESATSVSTAMSSAAPPGVRLAVRRDGELVEAEVSAQVSLLGIGRLLPAFTVTATAASVDDALAAP